MRSWYDTLFQDPRASLAAGLQLLINPAARAPLLGAQKPPQFTFRAAGTTMTVDPMAILGTTGEVPTGGDAAKGLTRIQQKMAQSYEGAASAVPLELPPVAPGVESPGDWAAWAAKMPSAELHDWTQYITQEHPKARAALRELQKRDPRYGIADIEHQALENEGVDLSKYHGASPASIWTREEEGARMVEKLRSSANLTGGPLQSAAQEIAGHLAKQFPSLPVGSAVAWNGERWVNTGRGWTFMGKRPLKTDYQWILNSNFDIRTPQFGPLGDILPDAIDSNPERAVELIQQHGVMEQDRARKIVGDFVSKRIKAGTATPHDVVWWNMHKMGELGPGGKISWF